MMPLRLAFSLTPLVMSFLVGELCADDHPLDSRIPRWGHNLLLDAKVSGNLVSFEKGQSHSACLAIHSPHVPPPPST